MKKAFRPEFINRIDETIVFQPLDQKEITAIVKLMIVEIQQRLETQEIHLKLSSKFDVELAFKS